MKTIDFDLLKASPLFKSAMAEVEGKRLATRRSIIKQIAHLEADSARELKRLGMAEKELATEVERLKEQVKALGFKLGEIRWQLLERGNADMRARLSLEAQLRADADPRIFRFIAWAQRAQNLAQYASAHQTLAWEGSAMIDAAPVNSAASSAAQKASAVIQHHIELAEGMVMLALSEDEVTTRLDEMAVEVIRAYNSVPSARSYPSNYEAPLQ